MGVELGKVRSLPFFLLVSRSDNVPPSGPGQEHPGPTGQPQEGRRPRFVHYRADPPLPVEEAVSAKLVDA